MQAIDNNQVDQLLSTADGNVSYQSHYARTTAVIDGGRVRSMLYASDYRDQLIDAERKAAYVAPTVPTVSGKRTESYTGPFPRKRHSHHCKGCEAAIGQFNAVACYKSGCTKPQLVATCPSCHTYYHGGYRSEIKSRVPILASWEK